MHISKKYCSNNNILNFLISLIPLTIIIGNTATNVNIILICLLGLKIYKLKIFKSDNPKYFYLLYSFFAYLIFITLFKNIPNLENNVLYKEHILKSLFFLRFLILFLVINHFIKIGGFNIKLFFISGAFFSSVLAIDILIQIKFGVNLFNSPFQGHRPTSFFGDEDIAGGYLQKFSLFFIFLSAFYFKSKKIKLIHILSSYLFFLLIIILIGNRMPALIYVSSIFLFYHLFPGKKKIILSLLIITLLIFTYYFKSNDRVRSYTQGFYVQTKNIILYLPKLFYYGDKIYFEINSNNELTSFGTGHLVIFNSGIQRWKEYKFLGGGLKSFRLNCKTWRELDYLKNVISKDYDGSIGYGFETCTTHPHNYTIEILHDTGLVGFILIYLTFFLVIIDFFKIYNKKYDLNSRLVSIPFFLIIFFEFFPLRSTGSFFTTNNSIVIFLMLSIFINVSKLNLINNKLEDIIKKI